MKKLFSILCLVLSLCFSLPVLADTHHIGNNEYVSGIPTSDFRRWSSPESRGRQSKENWCWAACIQMVLNYHGLRVDQSAIVQRVYGSLVDRPASHDQIVRALSGWVPGYHGRGATVSAYTDVTWDHILDDLHSRWPLIVGLTNPDKDVGHAYVLTGAYFYYDSFGARRIYRVVLRDPYPGNPSRIEMDAKAFERRLQFACRVRVSK